MYQIEQALHALDYCDTDLALKVIARDRKVNHYQIKIDAEVLMVLAEQRLIKSDLHTLILTGRIAIELEEIGNQLVEFTKHLMILFNTNSNVPDLKLLSDIFKLGNLVKIMLDKVMDVLEIKDSNQAYSLLQYGRFFEAVLQESMYHQLEFMKKNPALTELMINIMQVIQVLDRCGEHCRNIAEYLVFMFDGIDARHNNGSAASIK